ncbi:DEAD-domain-containing protein [Metschnikowia bicuspidata var. bicuspidata NRRL YB-4993]|uniref:ATP-dependent RNA helicase n=1 Tax=Metschnikowia bicuspidata var. bicuspidata NRRL YB-4993 TaxID=869754 RepID=A0A1A0HIQ2_9ASCO|nr:DEAD-domain-containing protein [Metschnikowia bicuspidata var. bicuspidata NRRL YB-4993]OBA23718.1 DEAD-domain-containing protein [Metschnikowia bicuspidata var. bicuspidata NRRL YB-4993]
MDDDGLILNFAVPDTTAAPAPHNPVSYSGGRWKERRNLRLQLQGRELKKASGANGVEMAGHLRHLQVQAEAMITDPVPPKKRPSPGPGLARSPEHNHPGIPSKRVKFMETAGNKGGKHNSYVSSLFTAKNSATLKESAPDATTHKPSNAPLTDDSTFEGLGLSGKLARHLATGMKYAAPTKVQRAVAPQLLRAETDLFVKAQTGSGKTLAFALPILDTLMREQDAIARLSGLFALILTPTRELALQIHSVLEAVLRCHHQIVPGIVVGGEKKKSEKARLRKGVNVLVATPGRLADHLQNTASLDVSQVRWLVLDEGDRLVELGFQETITQITDLLLRLSRLTDSLRRWPALPSRRVNVLCSATMPEDVKQLGSTVLSSPQMISVDRESVADSNATAPDQLVQRVMVVPPKLRLVTLAAALKAAARPPADAVARTMVFFSCSVNFHYEAFTRGGIATMRKTSEAREREARAHAGTAKDDEKDDEQRDKKRGNGRDKHSDNGRDKHNRNKDSSDADAAPQFCACTAPQVDSNTVVFRLHGSLSQQQRTSTLQQFVLNEGSNKGKHLVLFCTDVASRGLDLPNIAHVIEYDPPFTIDDHLHRIGRSARVGNKGEATLFLLPGEEEGYVDGKLRVVHPKTSNLRVVNYESILEKSFLEQAAPKKDARRDPKSKEGKWDIHATTWHLDVERWLLEDKASLDKALNAFVSHVRAYATHLSSERMYFNVKLLHLGHLAKAFGLRETPKKLGRTTGNHTSEAAKKKEDPRKKMLRMARMTEKARSSEFNY